MGQSGMQAGQHAEARVDAKWVGNFKKMHYEPNSNLLWSFGGGYCVRYMTASNADIVSYGTLRLLLPSALCNVIHYTINVVIIL